MHRRAVAAVILLAVVVVATVAILVTQQTPAPAPSPTVVPVPEGSTLLVQLRGTELLAMGSVLTGVDQQRGLEELYWRADWWIDQDGVQEISAAELGRKPVPYVMTTLQNQAQVRVDDAWVLDRLAFAGLVDAVGGVRIDLPRTTAYLNETGAPVLLNRGMHTMTGAQAADFVLDPSLKAEPIRLARFRAVWDQIVRRFPTDQEKARTLVVSLGALSKSTMNTEDLADYLTLAHEYRVTEQYAAAQVPLDLANRMRVRPAQGVRMAYAVDSDRMAARLEPVFDGFPTPDSPVARVQAMFPRAQTITQVRQSLDSHGWVSAWGGRVFVPETLVQVSRGVTSQQIVGLEQATGIEPTQEALPWGQARVLMAPEIAVRS